MRHYFIAESHSDDDYFTFEENFNGDKFIFNSCNDVFSKNCVDYGTKVLIKTIIKNSSNYFGDVLDVGCGYGALSIILEKYLKNCNFTLIDINSEAIKLAKKNKIENKSNNIKDIFESDLYSNVTNSYSHIISNPPIKTGKTVLINLITQGYEILNNGGSKEQIFNQFLKNNPQLNMLQNMQNPKEMVMQIAKQRGIDIKQLEELAHKLGAK